MTTDTLTHCQICGRAIKSKAGLIAHHGYRRPGDGWQTASCYGARHVPYEVGHDALDRLIASMPGMIAAEQASELKFRTEPPAVLKYSKRGKFGIQEPAEVQRPDGFDAAKRPASFGSVNSYGYVYFTRLHGMQRRIEAMLNDLEDIEKRRAAWTPPA